MVNFKRGINDIKIMKNSGINKIRILHLISTLDVGGAEKFLSKLVIGMDSNLFKNIVVSMTDIGPVGQTLLDKGIVVVNLDMKKGVPDPIGLIRLIKILKHYKIDIIQCWMYHANIFGLLTGFFFKKIKVLWNIRCSNINLSDYGFIYAMTVKAGATLSQLPNCIIVNSYAGEKFHIDIGYKYKSTKWHVIQNGVDIKEFQPVIGIDTSNEGYEIRKKLLIPEDGFVIALVARFDPMKDHKTFFNAVKIILEKNSQTHFILAGRGVDYNNSIIRNYMMPIINKSNIHLLGERNDIKSIYFASDVASSSSSGEGFSNAIAEAMITSIPVVTTDAGDSKLIVGKTGIVVPVQDANALADGWQQMINAKPEYLIELGKMAKERIVNNFNFIKSVKKYESLYLKAGLPT